MQYINTMDYYSTIKKNEIKPFVATWMDLVSYQVKSVRQRKTNTVWYFLYVKSKKKVIQMNLFTKQAETGLENKLMATRREGLMGEG